MEYFFLNTFHSLSMHIVPQCVHLFQKTKGNKLYFGFHDLFSWFSCLQQVDMTTCCLRIRSIRIRSIRIPGIRSISIHPSIHPSSPSSWSSDPVCQKITECKHSTAHKHSRRSEPTRGEAESHHQARQVTGESRIARSRRSPIRDRPSRIHISAGFIYLQSIDIGFSYRRLSTVFTFNYIVTINSNIISQN